MHTDAIVAGAAAAFTTAATIMAFFVFFPGPPPAPRPQPLAPGTAPSVAVHEDGRIVGKRYLILHHSASDRYYLYFNGAITRM